MLLWLGGQPETKIQVDTECECNVHGEPTLNTAWVMLNKIPDNQRRFAMFWTFWAVTGFRVINLTALALRKYECVGYVNYE